MFADLDRQGNVEKAVYQALRNLPIWLSSRGLIKATQALLPGNFTDPTGQADLLETSVLTDSAREFVSSKLGVQTQTIEAFVQNVLPRFFNDDGPLDAQKYTRLITELASHPALVNDENIRRLLGALPIVPTQDGRWSRPTNTYRRTDDLVKVLGDATHLWLDASRVPNARSVHTFIDSLGIRRSPLAQHLVERMLFIAEKYLPTEDAKRASGDAFYVLCDHYDEWKEKPFFPGAIDSLRGVACFPAEGDTENWHSAGDLYAPYRAEAFRSQANILDFRNTARLKTELLEDLDVTINPETRLVIDHLQYCVKTGAQPHVSTYQVLNERAQRSDPLISTLAGSRCIYVESQKSFVRPNQLYWSPQQLGRYAFTIPGNLEAFKPLFTAIGVKNAPEGRDYVDILLDIVGEYFEQSKPVAGADRSVYDACLMGVSAADEREEIGAPDIRRMQEAPTILNLMGQPTHPDEVLLQDSEWHAGFFNGELDRALCKPAPELWPFIEKVGVRRLSESAEVALEFVDGQKTEEPQLAEKLMERIDILARLLHDKPTPVKQKVRKALSELAAISYELVRIQASVHVGGDWASAPPSAAHAFYDIDKRQLILARPVGDRSWPHVLNAIFHQLMPEESGSEISKLTLSVRPLMSMPVEEAHRELTDAGIPYLDAESASGQADDLTSSSLADQEARRLVLTKDQIRVLDFLRSHRRVAVSGGAGTGKTVLALEKARRLASEGFRTLLTCYNRQLADHLSSLCAGTPNLDVMSFHQLCHRQVERANRASGRDLASEAKVTYPGKDLYEVQLPNALGYSLEVLPDRYDAIVCDEGQDFREEFWVPLELLLTDYDSSPLYVFYDDNQNLYARAGTFPIRDEPFSLTTNCRNTAPIHVAAYKHYKGVPVSPPDIQGDDVQFDESPSRDPQATKINARIVDLVARQGVAPGDITVLVADALHKAEYYAALRRLPLPKPATWLEEGARGKPTVLIDTIQRFKGLESPIVILWGLDTIDLSKRQELLYVGMSRAKSLLVIVGRAPTCAVFKDATKQ